MNTRLLWIDYVKAICMIGVYLYHSRIYFSMEIPDYNLWLAPFYVNAFFFVSGYLFFRKQLTKNNFSRNLISNLKEQKSSFLNIVFRVIIPTILFSILLYFPKILFHSTQFNFRDFTIETLGGISFWFTSAFAVAQIILLLLMCFGVNNLKKMLLSTFLLFIIGFYLNAQNEPPLTATSYFPWFYKTGMEYTFIMTLGGLYCRFEKMIDGMMKWGWIPMIIIYFTILAYIWNGNYIALMGLGGKCSALGFIELIIGVLLVIKACKYIKRHSKLLEFIGKNSIVFYFFSGFLPAAFSATAHKIAFPITYFSTLIIALMSIMLGTFLTYIIIRYIPFLTDLRKLNKTA